MTREERHRATVESHKGERYGKLVIIDEDRNSHDRARYLCKCDCGKVISTQYGSLKRGATISCGCARQERNARKHDEATKRYIGRRYGKLTVIAYDKQVNSYLYFIKLDFSFVQIYDFLSVYSWVLNSYHFRYYR